MHLSQLADLGEFIGGFAVVVTLAHVEPSYSQVSPNAEPPTRPPNSTTFARALSKAIVWSSRPLGLDGGVASVHLVAWAPAAAAKMRSTAPTFFMRGS